MGSAFGVGFGFLEGVFAIFFAIPTGEDETAEGGGTWKRLWRPVGLLPKLNVSVL